MFTAMIGFGLIQTADASCNIPKYPDVHVVVEPSPITIDTNFTLAQIEDLSRESNGPNVGAALGFYFGTFLDTVSVDLASGSAADCARRVQITVHIQIANRRIAVASELRGRPCFEAALLHYKLKADADEATVHQYANALGITLSALTLPADATGRLADFYSVGMEHVEQFVTSYITGSIESLHKIRTAAEQAVDTAQEMTELDAVCKPSDRR
jgi:hypothetical protein